MILSADLPANYPAGRLADSVGRKKTLILGATIGLIGLFLMFISRFFVLEWLFWVGIVIFGFSTGFIVLNRAAIMDMYPNKRGQSLGYLNTGGFIGAMMAPLLIAIITSACTGTSFLSGFNYYDIILFLCIPFIALSGFLLFGVRKDTKTIAQILNKNDTESNIDCPIKDKKTQIFTGPNAKRDLFFAFLIGSLSVGGVSIALSLSPTVLHILNVELGWISFAVALISFGTSGLSIFLGRASDKIGRKKIILIGIILMSIGLCVLPISQNVFLITVSNFLIGLGGGAMAIASTSLICDLVNPENRGKIFGINSIVINLFTLTLPPISAIFFTSFGAFSVSLIGLLMALIAVLSVFGLSNRS